ncbi:MAG: allophanate hydrolase subunit 1 [Campylobacteraceae bacterium]|nr:allophanate hydrolase subunit 1 [Campylobacteraceae bacterium]
MKINLASVDSLIIYFSDEISKETSLIVKEAYSLIKNSNDKAFIEVIPSYNSVLVTYDIFIYNFDEIKSYLEEILKDITVNENEDKSIITVDVYYGLEVGLDLAYMSEKTKLSIEEIINIHTSKVYDIYAIGFLPGFAYMASVDEKIAMARLENPRKKIPKGSVAIADNQTAIYPKDTPGGWNILGKTAFELFDKKLETLSPLSIKNQIQFKSISKEEFLSQGGVI